MNVENFHTFLNYEIDNDIITISLKEENDELNDIMWADINPYFTGKCRNQMWVSHINQFRKPNEELSLYIKHNADYWFNVSILRTKQEKKMRNCYIDTEGYFWMKIYTWCYKDMESLGFRLVESIYHNSLTT